MNGDIQNNEEGMLETCANGGWTPLCGDGWNNMDAQTACRSLGENPLGN